MAVPDLNLSDRRDMQALLQTGFSDLSEACFLLLRIVRIDAARDWLRTVPVTVVDDLAMRQSRAVQVALSTAGLRAMGLSDTVMAGFSAEFLSGMAEPSRSRRLGDVGANAPEGWSWGYGDGEPHVLVLVYAAPGGLAAWRAELATADFAAGFSLLATLDTSDMKGSEPFGFTDGVSQPTVDWEGTRVPDTDADWGYGNLIAAGEFALGYRNEYGQVTGRPMVADGAGMRDLGRNGSYLVLRQLDQDVTRFWQWMAQAAPDDPVGLAETVVGRRRDGAPLVAEQEGALRGVPTGPEGAANRFTFGADPQGLVCPIGAHVRRANPRTGDSPSGPVGALRKLTVMLGFDVDEEVDRVASSRFHRLIRRGREYGHTLPPAQAMLPDAAPVTAGLQFICLGANISRQFEFVQTAWLQSSIFAGLHGQADPLVANRESLLTGARTDEFSMPQAIEPARILGGMPRFVTLRGGGYFFLPGLSTLRYLAG